MQYAAIQFVVLVACAMALYAGGSYYDPDARGYELTHNFLSDLGFTRMWSGRSNLASMVLFTIALASLGLALIAFAWTWRHFAFANGRARWAGRASAVFGTASGLAYVGIASTPFNLVMHWHNGFVIAAFAFLLGYVACLTAVMARNGATPRQRLVNLVYLAVVLAYVVLVVFGPGFGTETGFRTQVIGQKIVVLTSMLYLWQLTTSILRRE